MYGKLNIDGTLQSANTKIQEDFISLELFEKDENGNYFEFYKKPLKSGIHKPDTKKIKASDDNKYIDLRKEAYAKLNQFDMQFEDQLNGTTTWVDAINKIKADFPKGSK